jgi:hypothetical protein
MQSPTIALAILCALTLSARVYTAFDGVRVKVVREAVAFQGSDLSVTMPETPRWSRMATPAVVIAKIQNPSPNQATVVAVLNGERLNFVLPAGGEHRLDLVVRHGEAVQAGDRLTFHVENESAVTNGCCTLQYLEVANLHGASNSIPSFIILPRGSRAYTAPGWIAIVGVTLVIAWLLARGAGFTLTRRGRWVRNALAMAAVLLFSVPLLSGLFAFTVLLSLKSFVLGALALTWPGIVRTWRELRTAAAGLASWAPQALEATVVAGIVAVFYGLVAQTSLMATGGNYSGFLKIGEMFVDRVPFLVERPALRAQLQVIEGAGYDGQFFYYIAFDPFLLAFRNDPARYRQIVDAPPYRWGRVGFSVLTKLFSVNDPERFPQTMIWLIVAASFTGVWCLAFLAQRFGLSGWWALSYALVPGFVQSLRAGLPEAVAAAFLLGGYCFFVRRRYGLAAMLLAASLLVRETGVILVIVLAIWTAWRDRDRRGGLIIGSAIVPLGMWRLYLAWRFFPVLGWDALFFDPHAHGLPFQGFVDLWQHLHTGVYALVPEMVLSAIFFPLLLIAVFILALYLLWTRPSALGIAVVAYGLGAMSLNYAAVWLHVGNGERATYEVFLLSIVLFLSIVGVATQRTRLVLQGFMVCALLYLWFASVDATLVRYVVLSSLS